ncbi:carboxymuconolactone decarboxylase family protein [Rhizobium leguminosarum]|uniref:carboxymuconolactone decarboxylase family protein n=1 Tax=Rhizobium leguminosarum TaxID=384 RepID=UPI0024A9B3AA|nr:carboxymuconolactone decarboxylase family protein [Rhizobium leguminosarum]MDI5930015.1 carboxymuconolactone decarboxylase family protein [Rhizobium leguminosarum]
MARVRLLTHEDLAPEDRELVWRRGNLYKSLSNSPEFTARFAAFGHYMNCASKISLRVQEIVILTVASRIKSQYEWIAHVKKSIELNLLTPDEIRSLRPDGGALPASFDGTELRILVLTRSLAEQRTVSDDAFAAVRADFDDGYMVELGGLVGMYLGLAHLIEFIKVDVEPDNLRWLEKFPLEASES